MSKRTDKQNRALHKNFELIADALNDAGFDMRETLKSDVDIPWNKKTVKEYLWRPIQQKQLDKDSTTELTRSEVDLVDQTLKKHLAKELGINAGGFPSVEQIYIQQDEQA